VCAVRADAGGHALLLEKLPRTSRVLDVSAQSEPHVHTRNAHRLLKRVGALTTTQLHALHDSYPTPVPGAGNAQRAHTPHLDQLDQTLLAILRDDARAPVEQLAATTGAPASTTRRRLARLRTSGTLRVDVDVDPRALGLHEQALLWINVAPADLATTGAALATHPEITFAAATTGRTSLYASIMTPDTPTLYDYLSHAIAGLPAIRDIESTLVIHSLKNQPRGNRCRLTPGSLRQFRVSWLRSSSRSRSTICSWVTISEYESGNAHQDSEDRSGQYVEPRIRQDRLDPAHDRKIS